MPVIGENNIQKCTYRARQVIGNFEKRAPGEYQRIVYNGYKRVHALKFQAIALPNGLIRHLFGPAG